jgi:hypothetical protein
MKLPCRILGLIAAAAAAPVIIGCSGESSEPSPNKTDQNIETQQRSEGQASRDEASESHSSSSSSAEPTEGAASDPSSAPLSEGHAPRVHEDGDVPPPVDEDAPLRRMPGVGRAPMMPYEGRPTMPQGGSGGPQDPCPACGMG